MIRFLKAGYNLLGTYFLSSLPIPCAFPLPHCGLHLWLPRGQLQVNPWNLRLLLNKGRISESLLSPYSLWGHILSWELKGKKSLRWQQSNRERQRQVKKGSDGRVLGAVSWKKAQPLRLWGLEQHVLCLPRQQSPGVEGGGAVLIPSQVSMPKRRDTGEGYQGEVWRNGVAQVRCGTLKLKLVQEPSPNEWVQNISSLLMPSVNILLFHQIRKWFLRIFFILISKRFKVSSTITSTALSVSVSLSDNREWRDQSGIEKELGDYLKSFNVPDIWEDCPEGLVLLRAQSWLGFHGVQRCWKANKAQEKGWEGCTRCWAGPLYQNGWKGWLRKFRGLQHLEIPEVIFFIS